MSRGNFRFFWEKLNKVNFVNKDKVTFLKNTFFYQSKNMA